MTAGGGARAGCAVPASSVEEHLDFARKLARRLALDDQERAVLADRLAAVERKINDPHLYLAVIGEFSSGKSTFVNALLRDDLLAVNAMPTTVVATRVRSAKELTVRYRLTGDLGDAASSDRPWSGAGADAARRRLSGILLGRPVPADPRQMLSVLTSDPSAGAALARLEVGHPATLLGEGVVIIDTPGTNADNDAHLEVTREVMATEADAAVVVLSATTPVSESLTGFLADALDDDLLLRCVFVVTRMDHIEPAECGALVEAIRARLMAKLCLPTVTVLPAAPTCVLRAARGGTLTGTDARWAEDFSALETSLRDHMRQQRQVATALSVLRLLGSALRAMQVRLDGIADSLAGTQRELDKLPIRDPGSFVQAQHRQLLTRLDKDLAAMRDRALAKIAAAESDVRLSARHELDTDFSKDSLNTSMRIRIPNTIQASLADIEKAIRQLARTYAGEALRSVASDLDEATEAEYSKLRRLVPVAARAPSVPDGAGPVTADLAGQLAGLESAVADAESGAAVRTGAGAATGAVIGSFLFPGVGTLVGGAVGAALGNLLGPSVGERRSAYQQQATATIGGVFADVRRQAEASLDAVAANCRAVLAAHCEAHIRTYRPIVAAALKAHAARRAGAEREQRRVRQDLASVRAHRQAIEDVRAQLGGQTASVPAGRHETAM